MPWLKGIFVTKQYGAEVLCIDHLSQLSFVHLQCPYCPMTSFKQNSVWKVLWVKQCKGYAIIIQAIADLWTSCSSKPSSVKIKNWLTAASMTTSKTVGHRSAFEIFKMSSVGQCFWKCLLVRGILSISVTLHTPMCKWYISFSAKENWWRIGFSRSYRYAHSLYNKLILLWTTPTDRECCPTSQWWGIWKNRNSITHKQWLRNHITSVIQISQTL